MEQGLDLSGEWVVTFSSDRSKKDIMSGREFIRNFNFRDEGEGKCWMVVNLLQPLGSPGIYRQEGDRIWMCFHYNDNTRPTHFQAGDDRDLLILRRFKAAK